MSRCSTAIRENQGITAQRRAVMVGSLAAVFTGFQLQPPEWVFRIGVPRPQHFGHQIDRQRHAVMLFIDHLPGANYPAYRRQRIDDRLHCRYYTLARSPAENARLAVGRES